MNIFSSSHVKVSNDLTQQPPFLTGQPSKALTCISHLFSGNINLLSVGCFLWSDWSLWGVFIAQRGCTWNKKLHFYIADTLSSSEQQRIKYGQDIWTLPLPLIRKGQGYRELSVPVRTAAEMLQSQSQLCEKLVLYFAKLNL